MKWRPVLPLPGFVLHPFTALVIAIVHLYLSFGHLAKLFGGDVQWTHFWKGFGALGGAYVFVVAFARRTDFRLSVGPKTDAVRARLTEKS